MHKIKVPDMSKLCIRCLCNLCLVLFLSACNNDGNVSNLDAMQRNETRGLAGFIDNNTLLPPVDEIVNFREKPNPMRQAYFGDLHVHTSNSFDAYAFGTIATPEDAYRYAQGKSLQHPSGYQMQLQNSLDFYAVTDHAMFMGVVKEAANRSTLMSDYPEAELVHNLNSPENMGILSLIKRGEVFSSFIPNVLNGILENRIDRTLVEQITREAWADAIRAANDAYLPGEFTTFAGYEYTSSTNDRGNLHRNVIFKNTDRLPAVPFSRLNSQNPEGLWDWMDKLREAGIESIAIPHNSNGSNGEMFKLVDWSEKPFDTSYSVQRLRNEPIVEITQVKGTSDTHPLLSPNDEWSNFEIAPFRVGTKLPSKPNGSFVRQAYLRGLTTTARDGIDPYRFGLIGSSDTHTGAISLDEKNFFSKAGLMDGTPELRGSIPVSFAYGSIIKYLDPGLIKTIDGKDYLAGSSFEFWSASGLAGVWAEENTRESIYAALKRKETFATSGPRIRVRLFASYNFSPGDEENTEVIDKAYSSGTPMGSEIKARNLSPYFLAMASSDPLSQPLQRLQVIKGYLKNGVPVEKIYDIACPGNNQPDLKTYRCPNNGAKVNLSDCSTYQGTSATAFSVLWKDPEFETKSDAFYYLRVLENPSCRWSTWDAIKNKREPRSDLPKTIQERAWSSPIWLRTKNS